MQSSGASTDVVVDSRTGLVWSRRDNGRRLNWHDAAGCVQNLDLGGFHDWRLPTLEELHGLWDPPRRTIRKPFELTGAWVWSGTRAGADHAWCFYYAIGMRVRYPLNVSYDLRALFVRDP